jgi:PAS domain S-box-containing protein
VRYLNRAEPGHPRWARRRLPVRAYFVAIVALFVVAAAGAILSLREQAARDARTSALADTRFAAKTAATQLGETIKAVPATVASLAGNPQIGQLLAHPAGCTLSFDLGAGAADRSHLDVLRPNGTVVCSSRPHTGSAPLSGYAGAPWLAQAANHAVLIAPAVDKATGARGILSAMPARGGIVVAFADLAAVGTHLASLFDGGRPMVFLVTTRSGRVVSTSQHPARSIGRSVAGTEFARAGSATEWRDLEGTTRIFGEAAVPGAGWRFFAGEDKAAAMAAAGRLERRQTEIILAGLAALLLVVWFAYRKLARPLVELGGAVRASSTGTPRAPVAAGGPAELHALAEDVNGLIASVNEELAERVRAEAQLRSVAAIVECSDDAIIGMTLEGTITTWNAGAERMYGYPAEEIVGQTVSLLVPEDRPDEVSTLLARVANGEAVEHHETVRVARGGRALDVSLTISAIRDGAGTVVGASAIARDVSVQRQLEARLRQSEKMEAIGNLAGGIAHDFNNILMIIRSCAALQLRRTQDEEVRHDALQIDAAAERAAQLTHQLLAFSRQQVLQPELTDLNAVVDDSLALLRRLLGEHIEIVRELEPRVRPILADGGQLGQVILNLAVNARDAMPGGGVLILRTENVFLDEEYGSEHLDVPPGAYTVLQITDSGTGMDEETKARAFDPFFTTKETGTGFGLATVHGIVKQSGGYVWLSSEVGLGTTFKVYFPVAEQRARPRRPITQVTSLEGAETILYVEDEEQVRPLIAAALRTFGYTVIEAANAAEALALTEDSPAVDLLITDVVMPGSNGRELAELLVRRWPGLKVLFTSGYPTDSLVRSGLAADRAAYIEKPYLPDALALKLRGVLETD